MVRAFQPLKAGRATSRALGRDRFGTVFRAIYLDLGWGGLIGVRAAKMDF